MPLLPPLDQLLPVGQEVAEGAALFALLCGWRGENMGSAGDLTAARSRWGHDCSETMCKCTSQICVHETEIGKYPSSLGFAVVTTRELRHTETDPGAAEVVCNVQSLERRLTGSTLPGWPGKADGGREMQPAAQTQNGCERET